MNLHQPGKLPLPLFAVKGQVIVICALAIMFTSCLGPKSINSAVSKKYGGSVPTPVKKKSDYITITSNIAPIGNTLSVTTKKTSHIIPLLFYWQSDYRNSTTLNPQLPVNNFTATVFAYSNKTLKQKLNGRHVALTLDTIPNKFVIDDKGHLVWLILYAIHWDKVAIQPENTDMVVSYKVYNADNTESKIGTITIPSTQKKLRVGRFRSMEKKIWEYLDQYNTDITSMSKMVVDKLVNEL